MKAYQVGLQNSVTSIYDKTKTTLAGRVSQKTLPSPFNSTSVLGAPLTKFIDVQTDTAPVLGVAAGMMHLTSNNRLFVLQNAPATGVLNNILLYNFNPTTGASSYVGKILFSIAAPATITIRGFKVDDSNTSNIKIFLGYVSTTASMGGLLMINKVNLASFVPTGITYYTAQGNDAAAVYSLELPNEIGAAHTMTAVAGLVMPGTYSANPAINTKIFAHNGISATHQYNAFDYSSAPQLSALAAFTASSTASNPVFTATGNHGLNVNDAVVITSNAPTLFTNSLVNTVQTLYYVIAAGLTATQFELSATLGGAAITPTSTISGITIVRANGICSNLFYAKTANLPTLGGGTLLLTNSENFCVPQSGPNISSECMFMATSTNFLVGKISELFSSQTGTLTNGANTVTGLSSTAGLFIGQTVFGPGIGAAVTILSITGSTSLTLSANSSTSGAQALIFGAITWPSLSSINVLGNGIDYVVPVPVNAEYDTALDRILFPVAGPVTLMKNWVNSQLVGNFGNNGTSYMEAQSHVTDPLQIMAYAGFEVAQGWAFYSSITNIGQRGIIALDIRSDYTFDYSYVVSPVIATPGGQILHSIETVEQMFDYTGGGVFYYRTSANITDAVFSSVTGGWSVVPTAQAISIVLNNYTQFKASASMTATPGSANVQVTTPFQLVDLEYTTAILGEISDYWDFSFNDSSSAIPTRIGFAQRTAYASVVPKLYFRAYDTSGNLLTTADTVTNAGNFQYSTDAGVTWLPLGTITNAVGTRLRFTPTTPWGVEVRVSLREA
jgi:hypothetical protein